ncbi:MAG: HipA domain-containing protein [Bacteroidaceae bacterium]|nr:HipA domain-containing protein [Bacteroidaceae bacterium]
MEFLMDSHGEWSLAPAFDVTYAFRPSSEWTAHHQITINGKNDNFTLDDLLKVAEAIKVKNGKEIIDEVQTVFMNFEDYMEKDIAEPMVEEMKHNLVLNILR